MLQKATLDKESLMVFSVHLQLISISKSFGEATVKMKKTRKLLSVSNTCNMTPVGAGEGIKEGANNTRESLRSWVSWRVDGSSWQHDNTIQLSALFCFSFQM